MDIQTTDLKKGLKVEVNVILLILEKGQHFTKLN